MTEIEVPIEQAAEEIHHQALHSAETWISRVALSSALLAVLAAVTALLAGHHANEAMIEQIQSSDHWAHYQAKSIKASILSSKLDLLEAAGHARKDGDTEKLAEYKKQQDELSEQAREQEASSRSHLRHHEVFARGVTMFQVAIGIAAIAVLVRRRKFWAVAMLFGLAGLGFLLQGLLI